MPGVHARTVPVEQAMVSSTTSQATVPWGLWAHEEEVPREGERVSGRPVVARWFDGSWRCWTRREKAPSIGESFSGLLSAHRAVSSGFCSSDGRNPSSDGRNQGLELVVRINRCDTSQEAIATDLDVLQPNQVVGQQPSAGELSTRGLALYATVANVLQAGRDLAQLGTQLWNAGRSVEAVDAQQALVDVLNWVHSGGGPSVDAIVRPGLYARVVESDRSRATSSPSLAPACGSPSPARPRRSCRVGSSSDD